MIVGSITAYRTLSGDTLSFRFETSKALWQGYNDETGAVSPDWTVAANQPTIIPKAFSARLGVDVAKAGGGSWSYNGTIITFDSGTGISTNFNGSFKINLANDALTIIKNLASSTNQNGDILTYVANWDNGFAEQAGGQIEVQIDKIGTTPYSGIVNLTTNTLNETGGVTSLIATAVLLRGTTTMGSGFTVKWYKQIAPTTVIGTSNTLTVNRSMVSGKETFFAEFYVDGVKVSVYYFSVYDMSDPAQIVFEQKSSNARMDVNTPLEYYVKLIKTGAGTQITSTVLTATFYNSRRRQITPTASSLTQSAGTGTLVFGYADSAAIDPVDGLENYSLTAIIQATY